MDGLLFKGQQVLGSIRLERFECKEMWDLKVLGCWGILDLIIFDMEGLRFCVRDNFNVVQV